MASPQTTGGLTSSRTQVGGLRVNVVCIEELISGISQVREVSGLMLGIMGRESMFSIC